MKLQPEQLEFLLDDLTLKLEHSLVASVSKRRTFLKVGNVKIKGFSFFLYFFIITPDIPPDESKDIRVQCHIATN